MEDQRAVYIRNQDGDTHYTGIREGLKEFLDSENGYRISFNIEGIIITLRRDVTKDDMYELDSFLENRESLDCAVTIQGKL